MKTAVLCFVFFAIGFAAGAQFGRRNEPPPAQEINLNIRAIK